MASEHRSAFLGETGLVKHRAVSAESAFAQYHHLEPSSA